MSIFGTGAVVLVMHHSDEAQVTSTRGGTLGQRNPSIQERLSLVSDCVPGRGAGCPESSVLGCVAGWERVLRAAWEKQDSFCGLCLSDNLLGISWVDSSWIPILNNGSVLDYFSERSNPFYDRTCNNEVVKMQRMTLDHLNQMVGVEYILLHAQEPILFIIRKQQRQSPTQVMPLADYYIIAGVIYQAPDLGSVINSRVLTAVHGIQSAFEEAMSYCRYHPSKGYWWHFKDQEEREKTKPKAKKKEEPSSIFQRQRVDALLLDLRQKFPPRFVQQKPGEKPIPVDQIKKEPEPVPEAVKAEEKETVKNAQSAGAKGPPEKRMRLQ
ncbi:PREDICTED: mediator of RNA polymerase II transcription subunit 6 [Ficedula albicollis]|nr:PREDICTED: mediator of RNA polymerase II transcription subunit 6 [Ficedula albicollis]